jgi:16S rRNA (guanine527-N7)-methyltransferase
LAILRADPGRPGLPPLPNDVEQRLTDGLARFGVAAGPDLTAALLHYLALLQKWNRAYNLTSITELDDMVARHILDSATARPYLAGAAILDAGTGAGLPGIPLALLEPARRFTLLDSVGKKIRFLHQAVAELRLTNVALAQARLEDWQPEAPFDTVICRAFGTLADFAATCGRFVAPAGRLVAMKGRLPADEARAVAVPWRVAALERVTVPGLDAERHIVVLER